MRGILGHPSPVHPLKACFTSGYLESACPAPPLRSHRQSPGSCESIGTRLCLQLWPVPPRAASYRSKPNSAHVPLPSIISKFMLETVNKAPTWASSLATLALLTVLCPSGKAWRPLPATLHKLALPHLSEPALHSRHLSVHVCTSLRSLQVTEGRRGASSPSVLCN